MHMDCLSTKSFVNQALELLPYERAIIVEKPFHSLDSPDAELDEIWSKEAEVRLDALEKGKLKKVSANSVLGNKNL